MTWHRVSVFHIIFLDIVPETTYVVSMLDTHQLEIITQKDEIFCFAHLRWCYMIRRIHHD